MLHSLHFDHGQIDPANFFADRRQVLVNPENKILARRDLVSYLFELVITESLPTSLNFVRASPDEVQELFNVICPEGASRSSDLFHI